MEWTAIATFILALIATASIIVTLIIRAKDSAENHKVRIQTREFEIKTLALNEIKAYTNEFLGLVFISGTSKDYNRTEWTTRFNFLIFERHTIAKYAELFSTELKKKVLTLVDCVIEFSEELTSHELETSESGKIFVVDSEKRLKLRDRVINDVIEIQKALAKEKTKLYIGHE
jgi:hypothetical protein